MLRLRDFIIAVFFAALSSGAPAFGDGKSLAACLGIAITTEKPVSGSVTQFLAHPETIDRILGQPGPEVGREFVEPARRAFEFMNFQTADLTTLEKVQIWETLAAELHRRYPPWSMTGPFRVAVDGSYVYQGGLGNILMIRARDGKMYVGPAPWFPQPKWEPDYYKLKTLDAFLKEKRETREKTELSGSRN